MRGFLRVADHLGGRAALGDDTLVEEEHLVGDLLGEPDLVGHHDHGPALGREVLHHAEHLADELRVERGGGLVEEHQLAA